uniref:RUN domain-containing protein n=1 Tax=Parastrongyloides trichosuri TaxID=131310 RepID=A0A0N4ZH02_PARTI
MSLLQTLNNFLIKIEDSNSPYNILDGNKQEIKNLTNDIKKRLMDIQSLLSSNMITNIESNSKSKSSFDSSFDDSNSINSKYSTDSLIDDIWNGEIMIHNFENIRNKKKCFDNTKMSKTDTLRSFGSSSGFSDGDDDSDYEKEITKVIFDDANKAFNEECYAKCVRLIEKSEIKKINLNLFLLCSKSYKKMLFDSESSEEFGKLSIYWLEFIEKLEATSSHLNFELHFLHTKNDCLWKCLTNSSNSISQFILYSTKLFSINWKIYEIVTKNLNCTVYDYLTLINNLISIIRYCIDEGLEKEENEMIKIKNLEVTGIGHYINNEKQNVHLFPIIRIEILNVKNCLKSYLKEREVTTEKFIKECNEDERELFDKITKKIREIEEDFVRKSMTRGSSTIIVNSPNDSFVPKTKVVLRSKNKKKHTRNANSTPPESSKIEDVHSKDERRISSYINDNGSHCLKLMIEPNKGISVINEENNVNSSVILRF